MLTLPLIFIKSQKTFHRWKKLPSMTSEVILHLMQNLLLHNDSIHSNFRQIAKKNNIPFQKK